jgi:hypothetical protein
MARKRSIKIEEDSLEPKPVPESDEESPKEKKDESWSSWFRRTYARYWYVIGCGFLDIITALETARNSPPGYSFTLPIILSLALIMVELFLYTKIWKHSKASPK